MMVSRRFVQGACFGFFCVAVSSSFGGERWHNWREEQQRQKQQNQYIHENAELIKEHYEQNMKYIDYLKTDNEFMKNLREELKFNNMSNGNKIGCLVKDSLSKNFGDSMYLTLRTAVKRVLQGRPTMEADELLETTRSLLKAMLGEYEKVMNK